MTDTKTFSNLCSEIDEKQSIAILQTLSNIYKQLNDWLVEFVSTAQDLNNALETSQMIHAQELQDAVRVRQLNSLAMHRDMLENRLRADSRDTFTTEVGGRFLKLFITRFPKERASNRKNSDASHIEMNHRQDSPTFKTIQPNSESQLSSLSSSSDLQTEGESSESPQTKQNSTIPINNSRRAQQIDPQWATTAAIAFDNDSLQDDEIGFEPPPQVERASETIIPQNIVRVEEQPTLGSTILIREPPLNIKRTTNGGSGPMLRSQRLRQKKDSMETLRRRHF